MIYNPSKYNCFFLLFSTFRINLTSLYNICILTVNVNASWSFHYSCFRNGAVPHGAAIGWVIIFLLWNNCQNCTGSFSSASAGKVESLHGFLDSILVPEDLWRRRTSDTGAGQIELLSLGDGGVNWCQCWGWWRKENNKLECAGVKFVSTSRFNFSALKVTIVSFIGGVLYP